jgi:DNA mismatch repair protein MutS2
MDSRALENLEFNVVKDIVADFAISDLGRDRIRQQEVMTSSQAIRRDYDLVKEMIDAIAWRETMPIDGLSDVRPSLRAVRPVGTYLDPPDLLRIHELLKAAGRLKRYLGTYREDFPKLHAMMERCQPVPEFDKAVRTAINPDGEIASNATPELAEIRHLTTETSGKIEKIFDRMIRSAEMRELLQETYVTERKGRKVLPVKSEFRSQVSGIVHDVSISGGTVFVEPMSVVGLSNELTELAAREKEEIRRILLSLSNCLRQNLEAVLTTVETMSEIDMLYAKARFAARYKCSIPGISTDRSLKIVNGRHPLLLKSKEDQCVPLNVSLRDSDRVLVISGPNAGGKTSAAKTIAVLCLLAQSSTPIPADVSSVLPICNGFFADIGDYQDISLGVSTFTSHLGEVKRILENVSEGSLVVLDELGTATDPAEGAVLAEAILEELTQKGALAVVTSHLPSLKTLGMTRQWARSAAVGLDPQTEKPNFVLSMDIPGESSGLTIARQLGIPRSIVERAYSLMSDQQRDLSHELEAVRKEKAKVLTASRELQEARSRVEEEKNRYEDLLKALEAEKGNVKLEKLKFRQTSLTEKQKILREARKRIEKMIAALPSRKHLSEAKRELHDEDAGIEEETRQVQKEIDKLTGVPARDLAIEEIREGMVVWARNLRQPGTVKAVYRGGKKADLVVDGVVFTVDADQLAECPQEEMLHREELGRTSIPRKELATTELNLVGERVEKAIGLLDQFINDASLSGVDKIRVIHGYGTGALRKGIRDFVASHPLVEGFRPEDESEGEGGAVTIVKLK